MTNLEKAIQKLKRTEHLLLVDKKKHEIFVYNSRGESLEKIGYPCSLGMKGWPTPKGLFRIDIKYHKERGLSESCMKELKDHKLEESFDKFYYNNFYFGINWKGNRKRRIGWYLSKENPTKKKWVSLAIHGSVNEQSIVEKQDVSHGCIWMRKKDIEDILDKNYISKGKDTWVLIQ